MLERWLCECTNQQTGNRTLLGWIEDRKIIRVKRRDLFIEIEGGKVTMNCYHCGKKHILTDSNFSPQKLQNLNERR